MYEPLGCFNMVNAFTYSDTGCVAPYCPIVSAHPAAMLLN